MYTLRSLVSRLEMCTSFVSRFLSAGGDKAIRKELSPDTCGKRTNDLNQLNAGDVSDPTIPNHLSAYVTLLARDNIHTSYLL